MESIDLTLADEALGAIARKAIERKTGARGLRSIMEGILLDTMFDLPSLEGVEEVVISREVVEGTARPLYIYADRADRASDAERLSALRACRRHSLRFVDGFASVADQRLAICLNFRAYLTPRAARRHLLWHTKQRTKRTDVTSNSPGRVSYPPSGARP